MYTAILLSGKFEKGGFKTEEAAWDYVHSQMCESCQQGYKDYLAGNEEAYFACDAEWDVSLTSEWNKIKEMYPD